jgi:hypothetical protein
MKDNQEIAKDYTEWLVKTGGCARDMALRDHFAGLAMQSLIIETGRALQHCEGVDFSGLVIVDNEDGTPAAIAEESYALADAMLKERNK